MTGDLLIELLVTDGEAFEGSAGPGRDLVIIDTSARACKARDQAGPGQVTELGPYACAPRVGVGCGHDQRLELHDHLGFREGLCEMS